MVTHVIGETGKFSSTESTTAAGRVPDGRGVSRARVLVGSRHVRALTCRHRRGDVVRLRQADGGASISWPEKPLGGFVVAASAVMLLVSVFSNGQRCLGDAAILPARLRGHVSSVKTNSWCGSRGVLHLKRFFLHFWDVVLLR